MEFQVLYERVWVYILALITRRYVILLINTVIIIPLTIFDSFEWASYVT